MKTNSDKNNWINLDFIPDQNAFSQLGAPSVEKKTFSDYE